MAVDIGVNIQLDDSSAQAKLESINQLIKTLTARKYKLQVDAAGTEIAAKNLAYLTSSAAKFDAQIKESEAAAKRFAAALQSQMQAGQAAEAAHQGMASSMNGVDQMIQRNEAASRAFSAALREQMQAEEETIAAHQGMASSMTVIDRAIKTSETASKNFSDALRQQMEAEQEASNQAREDASSWSVLGGAIATALGSLASRAVHMALSKITQGIREAITEMKEVDTQLTNISKVSGITGKALSDMGERAYETASKYGVAADEYLSAVYTFQKAGLGPSAEAMGELAVKTMLVGDTTADVASQFLISANAAWKMGGDIERLNQIVDEADYINNNYATDLGKLSQGLPRVASVAAQAGMSAEETLAAIGTITAVTQESGQKSATALRALILNIEKEVGEFMDDTGETFKVTEESVKSVQGLMEKYAKAELDAAKASGELINPMTAIKAIFEGMANSDLNDQDLFALLSGMGGKLRTNQLTALVQNYELFDEMLGKIANSAGTADNEIALMMESWERKTQVLKNTWTEFIADVVSTEFMKDTVEGLTSIVEIMDRLAESSDNPWYDSGETNKEIESTEGKIKDLLIAISELYLKDDENSKLQLHDLEVELQIQQEILETKKKQYELEHAEEAKKLQKELTRGYFDSTGTYTSVDIEEVATLGRRLGEVSFEGNISEYQKNLATILSDFSDYYEKVNQVKDAGVELTADQERFIKNYELANNLAEQQGLHIGEQVDGYWQLVDSTGRVVASVKDITQEQEEQQKDLEGQLNGENFWTRLGESLKDYESGVQDATTQTEGIYTAVQTISFQDAIAGALRLARALGDAAANASNVQVGAIGHTFASGTTNAPAGPALVNELGPELISDNGRAYIANGGRPAVVNLSRGAVVLPADVTKEALKGGMPTRAFANGTDYGTGLTIYDGGGSSSTRATDAQRARQEAIDRAYRERQAGTGITDREASALEPTKSWTCPKCGTVNSSLAKKCTKCGTPKPGTSGGGGKKTGGGGKSKKEKAAEAAKDLEAKLKSLDKQAALAHKEKRYSDEEALYKEAVALIKKQLSKYKSAGYKDKSDEVVDLKSKLHDYEDKIESLNKNKWDEEIEAREQALREQRARDEMADKQAAVEKARQALENARKQRNVRVFNAATGQWEWVADQGAVQKAQEQFDSAQQAWTRAQEDAAIDELKRRRDAGEKYPGGSGSGTEILDTISTYGGVGQAVTVGGRSGSKIIDSIGEFGALFGGAPTDTSISTAVKNGGGGDSHDTIYNFGNITLSEAEAKSTSVAELAKRLNVLKIS